MEKTNHLSDNLRAYQHAQGKSLAELSLEFGIARSTIQSVMTDGNTTLDTLIRIACAMHCSLDELVFGGQPVKRMDGVRSFMGQLEWFAGLPAEKQEKLVFHSMEILKLLEHDE